MINKFFSFFRESNKKKTVLFYRNFQGFQGGHLKTWNYFNHLKNNKDFIPKVYFTDSSKWDENPWRGNCVPEKEWNPDSADILFLAGLDWSALKEKYYNSEKPIINLIQHVRHADPQDIRYQYLKNRAIRICVGKEVTAALLATNCVNGPIYTIPNGIDLDEISTINSGSKEKTEILISGLKNKPLAMKLYKAFNKLGIKVECQLESISRSNYLRKLSSSKISILLPARTEGFYLPALESMAVGSLVICPDCIGNRGFCTDNINCYMPPYNFHALLEAGLNAMNLDVGTYQSFLHNGYQTANEHSLTKEKDEFYKIISTIEDTWRENK